MISVCSAANINRFEQELAQKIAYHEQQDPVAAAPLKMEFVTTNLAAQETANKTAVNTTINSRKDLQNHNDSKGAATIKNDRAYTTIMATVGVFMLIMVIDLWFIMDGGQNRMIPYYLVKTDTQIKEEKDRKEFEKEKKSKKINRRKSLAKNNADQLALLATPSDNQLEGGIMEKPKALKADKFRKM